MLWQNFPHKMQKDLRRHDHILRRAIENNEGRVFKTVGDAFCAAFDTALNGLKAAVAAQLALIEEEWAMPQPLLVRMALHTGEAEEREQDYYGPALNRTARMESIGHGGQTLISLVTSELLRDFLPDQVTLKDLGRHRLKDLTRPESVFQLCHPDLVSDFPPVKSLDIHPHNLPMQSTSLIGREKELIEVRKLLLDNLTRIVTLTGPGGMGKTRLGLQISAELIEHFKDGVFFVDLSAVSNPELLMSQIAAALNIRERANQQIFDSVKEHLHHKELLLLLDNFEQIISAEMQVKKLLAACHQVKALVTSREALHLRGERVFAVPPLKLPHKEHSRFPPLEELTQYEAVRLFIERAIAAKQDFRVTNDTAPALAEICIHLDGIPLAIELAAARITLLPLPAILKRLSHRLKILTSGPHDLPQRHKTLRATIDWSYNLLANTIRRLFRTLAVFSGGFTIEAAEAICPGLLKDCPDILTGIESLLDKSLLTTKESAQGEARFDMLETIREYGLELLRENDIVEDIRESHGVFFLKLAEKAAPQIGKSKEGLWLHTLALEHDNLQEALHWFEKEGDSRQLQLCGALCRFWQAHGHLAGGREELKRALAANPAAAADLRAEVLLGAGSLARKQGDYEESLRLLKESQAIYRDLADSPGEAQSIYELGWTCYRMAQFKEARSYFSATLRKADQLKNEEIRGLALFGLGSTLWSRGKTKEAKQHLEECSLIFARAGQLRLQAHAVLNSGLTYYQTGDYKKAEEYFRQAMAVDQDLSDLDHLRFIYNNLGYLYYCQKKHEQSNQFYQKLLDAAVELKDSRYISTAYAGLADNQLALQNNEEAMDYAHKALLAVEELEKGIELGVSHRVMGEVTLANEEWSQAKEAFALSIPLLQEAGDSEELARAHAGYKRAIKHQGGLYEKSKKKR